MNVQQQFVFSVAAPAPGAGPPTAEAAVATRQRRNLVIEAGAGTGKTTAIVAEVLKLLLGDEELAPERIVLMTFTEKAAGEIADRIHQALTEIHEGATTWPAGSQNPLLIITAEQRAACTKQLARIDSLRSQTIHSFCQTLLRQFPIEAGLDPQFTIVEGFERSRLYGELYDAWIDEETRVHPTDEAKRDWEVLIEHAGYLFLIRDLVFELLDRRDLLLDESYDIGSIAMVEDDLADAIRVMRIEGGDRPMARYFRANEPPRGDLDAWIDYLKPVTDEIRDTDLPRGRKNDAISAALKILRGSDKKGDSIVDRLTSHRASIALLAMTRRFIAFLDREKWKRGVVDFDDLLLRTVALLDDETVLERVRRQFDTIFVDEFQDTDRVQARIIQRLAPGRLVVVGDPKQSIYGFRRADPETYDSFTRSLLAAGAERSLLLDQYRSEPPLLDAINDLFARIFEPIAPDPNVFSPPYHALRAARSGGDGPPFIVLTCPTEDKYLSEAEAIAAWIKENSDGDLRRFAILLRRMTKLDDYLDVFDRHGIDYVLPPTRLFLDRPAAVDLVAVLRAIAYPFDRGAEASAARSPYFALTDLEIVRSRVIPSESEGPVWAGSAQDDLQGAAHPHRSFAHAQDDNWAAFRAVMHDFREAARHLTVSATIDLVVETCGIERVYAAAADRDRAMRHLEHLRGIAFQYDQTVGGSLRQFVDEVGRRRRGEPDEMEPSLLDDASNGVRILTVHGAKGLEFDTVILPDLEFRLQPQELYVVEEPRLLVMSGQVSTLSTFAAKDVGSQREEAETRRLFYVAVTRAKSRVVFVTNEKSVNMGFSKYVKEHCVGAGFSRHTDRLKPVATPRKRLADAELEAHLASSPILPWQPPGCEPIARRAEARPTLRARAAGIVMHRFLERWDGVAPPEPLLALLAREHGCDDDTLSLVRRRVTTLTGSETFRTIAREEIVGRELPIAFLDSAGNVVERRLDRLIRIGGEDVVVDYKSGEADDARLLRDRAQVEEYCRAVAGITGRPCRGMLWYIDAEGDRAVDV